MLLSNALNVPQRGLGAIRASAALVLLASMLGCPQAASADQAPSQTAKKAADDIASCCGGPIPITREERLRRVYGSLKVAQSSYVEARDAYQRQWLAAMPSGVDPKSFCAVDHVAYTSLGCERLPNAERADPTETKQGAESASKQDDPQRTLECTSPPPALQQACGELLKTEPHMVRATYQYLRQLSLGDPNFENQVEHAGDAIVLSQIGRSDVWNELQTLVGPGVTDQEIPQLTKILKAALQNDKSLWPSFATFLQKLSAKGVSEEDLGSLLSFFESLKNPQIRAVVKEQFAELERTQGATRVQVTGLQNAVDRADPVALASGILELTDAARKQALIWIKRANSRQRYLQQENPAGAIQVAYQRPAAEDTAASRVLTDFINHLVALLAATTAEGVLKPAALKADAWKSAAARPMSVCPRCDAVLLIGAVSGDQQLVLSGQLTFREIPGAPNLEGSKPETVRVEIPLVGSGRSDDCSNLAQASDAAAAASRFMHQLRRQIGVAVGDVDFVRQLQATSAIVEPLHCGVTVDAQLFGLMSELRPYLNGQHRVHIKNDASRPCNDRWVNGIRLGLETRDIFSEAADGGVELRLTAPSADACVGEVFLDQQGAGKGAVYEASARTSSGKLHSQGGVGMAHYVAALYPSRYSVAEVRQEEAVASRWNALWVIASPGLPWLADDVDEWNNVGIAASAADVLLWVGAAGAYARSIQLRDEYAVSQRPETQEESGDFRRLANGAVVSALALRLVAAAVYLARPPADGPAATTADLTRGWTWTF